MVMPAVGAMLAPRSSTTPPETSPKIGSIDLQRHRPHDAAMRRTARRLGRAAHDTSGGDAGSK
jgi:hypothetical protein